MKNLYRLFVATLCLCSFSASPAAESASVIWSGLMLHFNVGAGGEFQNNQTYPSTMSLDTIPPDVLQPGLLTVSYTNNTAIWKVVGFYRFETPANPQDSQPEYDDFILALPMADRDNDGVPDFFEIPDPVEPVQTTGIFEFHGFSEDLLAVWTRAANSPTGECRIQFTGSLNPGDPKALFISTYTNHFSLVDLKGTLTYRAGWQHTTGEVAVARDDSLYYFEGGGGRVNFVRSNSDQLDVDDGQLSYYGNDQLQYIQTRAFSRVESNYWGIVRITNGVMASLDPRYRDWLWRMVDLNDADHDGVPDLSDDAPAFPALLSAQNSGQDFMLKIDGEPGATYTLQSSSNLTRGSWSNDQGITLPESGVTNFTKTSVQSRQFWRALFP